MIAPWAFHSACAFTSMLGSQSGFTAVMVPAGGAGFRTIGSHAESERVPLCDAGINIAGVV